MKAFAKALASVLIAATAVPLHADVLIDNVNGLTVGDDGEIETFAAILIGDDGRIEQVFDRRDKKPGKVDYRLDGKGRVMIPGIIDSHVHVMELGFALLRARTGFSGATQGEPRPEDRDLAFADAQQALLESGVTTAADMGTSIENWQTYRRAGDLGALRIRIVSYATSAADMVLIGGPGPTPWLYQDKLKHNGLSLVLDGPLETREAWLKAPYSGSPGKSDNSRMTGIQLRNLMSRGAIDNFQVAVTAHGDAATESVLDAIEELSLTYTGDRRWRIEALSMLDPADIARIASTGAIASVQPGRLEIHRTAAESLIGAQRAPQLHRWRSMSDTGVQLALGSGTNAAPPRPFSVMALAIARQDSEGLSGSWQPQEALTRTGAFKAFTNGAAHALFAEGRLGRIAKGYRADFLFIDRDPSLASPHELSQTRVIETWIGGVKVYGAEVGIGKTAIDSFKDR